MSIISHTSQLKLPTRGHQVAEQLKWIITSSQWTEGTRLLPERDLAERLGVSPPMVAQALRILESQGLLRVKPGRNGGVFVTRPTVDTVTQSLALLLQYEKASLADVMFAREFIECACTSLAAERATQEDVAELDASVQRMSGLLHDNGGFLLENVHFHVIVADATKNIFFRVIMNSLKTVILMSTSDIELNFGHRQGTLQAHVRIAKAIRAREPEQASHCMKAHMGAFAARIAEVHGDLTKHPIRTNGLSTLPDLLLYQNVNRPDAT